MAGTYRCDHVSVATSPRHSVAGIAQCTVMIVGYRSCGCVGCKVETGFCPAHGGDEMAISAIQTHMHVVHGKQIPG